MPYQQRNESIPHWKLRDQGPTQARLKERVYRGRSKQGGRPFQKATLIINGQEVTYFCSAHVADKLDAFVGQDIELTAYGDDNPRNGGTPDDDIEIQPLGGGHAQPAPQRQPARGYQPQQGGRQRQAAPQQADPTIAAKTFMKQAANLYRIAQVEAQQIAEEINATPDHYQSICSCLFIEANKQGLANGLPVSPIVTGAEPDTAGAEVYEDEAPF